MACSKRKTIICWETTNGNAANKRVMMSVVGGAKNTQKVAKKPSSGNNENYLLYPPFPSMSSQPVEI